MKKDGVLAYPVMAVNDAVHEVLVRQSARNSAICAQGNHASHKPADCR